MRMSAGKFESFLFICLLIRIFSRAPGKVGGLFWPTVFHANGGLGIFVCSTVLYEQCCTFLGRKFVKMVTHPVTLNRLQLFMGKGLSSCVISRLLRCKLSVSCPPHVLSFSENKWRKWHWCSTPRTSVALHSWLIISHWALRVGLYFFQCWYICSGVWMCMQLLFVPYNSEVFIILYSSPSH